MERGWGIFVDILSILALLSFLVTIIEFMSNGKLIKLGLGQRKFFLIFLFLIFVGFAYVRFLYVPISTEVPVSEEILIENPIEESLAQPAVEETAEPTVEVTMEPTVEPTVEVTVEPTVEPTVEVTVEPTVKPTVEVTVEPTVEPTVEVTVEPTVEPAVEPTVEPTVEATVEPTVEETVEPVEEPTPEIEFIVSAEPQYESVRPGMTTWIYATTTVAATKVTVNSSLGGGTYNMHRIDDYNWKFEAELYVIGEHTITIEATGINGSKAYTTIVVNANK